MLQISLLVAGEQPIHSAELPATRNHIIRALSDLERALAPALPFPRSGFIGTLAAEIRMHEKGHIQGHRYALVDGAGSAAACAGTPLTKLQTATSTTCQATLSLVWHDCQRHLAMERARRRRELHLDARGGAADCAEAPGEGAAATAAAGEGAAALPGGGGSEEAAVSCGAAGDAEAERGEAARESPSPGDGASEAAEAEAKAGGAAGDGRDQAEGLAGEEAVATGGAAGEAQASGGGALAEISGATGGGQQAAEVRAEGAVAAVACAGDPAVRMEMLAQAPNRKWIVAKWALGGELVHADDVATRDRNSLASAHRNVQGMLSNSFPGVLGL